MKKIKKGVSNIKFLAAVLIVTGLLITLSSSATITNKLVKNENHSSMPSIHRIDAKTCSLAIPNKLNEVKENNILQISLGEDKQITDDPDDEVSPSIALDAENNIVIVDERQVSILESFIDISVSTDDGETWPEELKHTIGTEGLVKNPWISFRGHERMAVATWTDTINDGGNPIYWLDDLTDTSSWGGGVQDWSGHDFFGFHDHKISGYYWEEHADQFWGMECFIGSTDYGADQGWDCIDAPMLYLDIDAWIEGNVGINWLSDYNNSRHPTIDIDQSSGVMYFAFENFNETSGSYDILIWFGECEKWWDDDYIKNLSRMTAEVDYTHPCISARAQHLYLAFQTNKNGNEDIICVHTTDDFETFDIKTIVDSPDDEINPSIVSYGERIHCSFTKNGNLYATLSTDSGETWSNPQMVNDEDGTAVSEWRSSQLTLGGNIVWTDDRNVNRDIYFESLGVEVPILNIEEITGGFGISAIISNTGGGDATNIQWSIDLDGGLILVGKGAEGTISSLPAGDSTTVKIPLVLGFGGVTILAVADGATKTASGTVLLFFVTGVT